MRTVSVPDFASENQLDNLMCPAKEIFNVNTNAHFIKKRKREEISSDEESVD